MKNILIYSLITVITMAVAYLMVGFCCWNLNPCTMSMENRVFVILLFLIIWLIIGCIASA